MDALTGIRSVRRQPPNRPDEGLLACLVWAPKFLEAQTNARLDRLQIHIKFRSKGLQHERAHHPR